MELWIRSQDKEKLVKVSTLFVEYNGDVDPIIRSHRIVADKCIDLGIYKSKERALEVLDEIQCHLVNINDSRDSYFYVYEMPKE